MNSKSSLMFCLSSGALVRLQTVDKPAVPAFCSCRLQAGRLGPASTGPNNHQPKEVRLGIQQGVFPAYGVDNPLDSRAAYLFGRLHVQVVALYHGQQRGSAARPGEGRCLPYLGR